jgi:hypothetical protein
MSLRFSIVLAAAAAISVSVLTPMQAETTITGRSLGTVETILGYCARIDPVSAAQYKGSVKMFTAGHSEKEVERDQKDKGFTAAAESIDSQLKKVPLATGLSACKAFLAGK